jgi:hypothetical protein
MPPWVAMIEDEKPRTHGPYLVSWVPNQFVELVQRGIDVNPERCIDWLDQCDVALRDVVENVAGN